MIESQEFDIIIIGSGPAGRAVARRSIKNGFSAALIESELFGGDCHYWACLPSKALLRPPEALEEVLAIDGAKQALTGKLDVGIVLSRRDEFTDSWDDSRLKGILEQAGVFTIRGRGRLIGPRSVSVESRDGGKTRLKARLAVILAAGSRADIPDIPGLDKVSYWTSREAAAAKYVPERLAIIGGGPVACEMATAWSSLGAKEVTVIERSERLLSRYEPFAGEMLEQAFASKGVNVRTRARVKRVNRANGGKEAVLLLDDGSSIKADELLVATGRRPNTDDLGLETVGLEPGTWLIVDDSCQVKGIDGGWLYAVGDINNRALLTHVGKYQARACIATIAARAHGITKDLSKEWGSTAAKADRFAVPQVVFTDPQVATVGLTERVAKELKINTRSVDSDIGATDGAMLHSDSYIGKARIVVDEDRQVLIGATFVGPQVGELLHAATVAIIGEVKLEKLWHAIPSFPTMSEIWLNLLESYGF